MLEPLYTADEMRAAEERYPGYPESVPDLMDRAGRAVAAEVATRYPNAQFVAAVCGGGSNGGDGRVAAGVPGGRRADRGGDPGRDGTRHADCRAGREAAAERRRDRRALRHRLPRRAPARGR